MNPFTTIPAWFSAMSLSLGRRTETRMSWRDHYNFLRSYYLNNGLYDNLRSAYSQMGYERERLKSLRNPASRVVEFYAAKMWPGGLPGALPIVADNPRLLPLIEDIWGWSNWGSEKQAVARSFPEYGDLFLKVATRADTNGFVNRVFIQNVEPQDVTEIRADERGYLTYIRMDTPQLRHFADKDAEAYTLTEVWDKGEQRFRRWEHSHGHDIKLNQLGTPSTDAPFAALGIDFIPVVWQPFKHIGDERGMAAITVALDKIDEANRQATQLHRILFRNNRALWASSAGGVDNTGRPLPALNFGTRRELAMAADSDTDDIINLPGNATLTSLIPPINYDAALNVLNAQMMEIRQDLPEMIYSQIQEQSQLSGVAIGYLLEAATDRLLEARGNAETALMRAQEMALTMGSAFNLPGFQGIGTYANGDFAHSFPPRPVLTPAEFEKAQIVQTYTSAGTPLTTAVRRAGWSEDEIAAMVKEKDKEASAQQAGIAAALLNAQQQFDQDNPPEPEVDEEAIADNAEVVNA